MDAAWQTWKDAPGPDTLGAAVDTIDPVIVAEIQRYNGPKEILYWQGKNLAVKALETYDPTRGAALRSWVVTGLKPLSRYSAGLASVRSPDAVRRQYAELMRKSEELHNELGRPPRDSELADSAGLSKARIKKIRERVPYNLSESGYGASDTDEDMGGRVAAVANTNAASSASEFIYSGLSDAEKSVFDWKTGMHGSKVVSNQEIAMRLGVSPAYVSMTTRRLAQRIQEAAKHAV